MSADEVRLRIEEAVSLIAGIAVDRISDDARFIEDLGLDSLSIIVSLVVGQEFRGGRRRAVTPVARPVPPMALNGAAEFGYIGAQETGTRTNDRVETLAVKQVFTPSPRQ